jgi:tRNA(fMet)-specific endonuclease VapC
MLDTNILSDIVRNPRGVAAAHVRQIEIKANALLSTSIVVAAESKFGALKKGSKTLSQQIDELFKTIEVLPLPVEVDQAYANLRVDLEKRGLPIGANDMLIAAHALATGSILVTDNVREFTRVKGLTVENWLRK